MPEHIKDRIELEEFGMLFGLGREPNRWDDDGYGDGRYSYEERGRWYNDPYSPSYYEDYYPDEEWDYPHPYHFNLATSNEPAKLEKTLYQALSQKSRENKEKPKSYFDLDARKREFKLE